jgi:hypothetical protein
LSVTTAPPHTADEYGSIPPTQAALDAANRLTALTGWQDCGTEWLTSGWPTTTSPSPVRWTCIVTAAGVGLAARHVVAARDHHGGADVIIYDVRGPRDVHIASNSVDPAGAIHRGTEQDCTGLTEPDDYRASPACLHT